MSQHVPKAKENGTKSSPSKHICPPGPHAHPHPARPEAGDDATSEASRGDPIPENIQRRINALKHIHVDVQKIEQDMYSKLFLVEAEHHKKLTPFLVKRAQIINGAYEPTQEESEFSLKAGEEKQVLGAVDETQIGIPDFWLNIFASSMQIAQQLNDEDTEALKYLLDVRCVYSEAPLGFKLEFEFKENPFFTNALLTRSYEFATEVERDELYLSSGLAPKTTLGTDISWKEGKDTCKKEIVTSQRNKKTGERRQVKTMKDQESFFQFFKPAMTDLSALAKIISEDDEDEAQALAEKAEQAEADFEVASYIRTRVIPRALLIFTGDDDDDESYGDDEGDYDEDDEEDEDDEDAGPAAGHGESDSDESGDAGHGKKNGGGGPPRKQVARRS